MELLAEAFTALRRERGRAWNAACDIAEAAGKRRPALKPYGIHDIRRLARRFGIRKTHCHSVHKGCKLCFRHSNRTCLYTDVCGQDQIHRNGWRWSYVERMKTSRPQRSASDSGRRLWHEKTAAGFPQRHVRR
jgi:hypothetical protein